MEFRSKFSILDFGLVIGNKPIKFDNQLKLSIMIKKTQLLFLLFFGIVLNVTAQECGELKADTKGAIKITVSSADVGECFELSLNGKSLTPSQTNNLIFMADAVGPKKVQLTTSEGGKISKNIMLSPDQKSALFIVKKNKKGKYSLKNKLMAAELTDEAIAANKEEREKEKAEREAKKAKSDAEWDAAREADKKRMSESIKSSEGAKLNEYKDDRKGVEGNKNLQGKEGQKVEGKQGWKQVKYIDNILVIIYWY